MALDEARGSDAALPELPVRARDRTVPYTLSGTAVNVAEVYAQFVLGAQTLNPISDLVQRWNAIGCFIASSSPPTVSGSHRRPPREGRPSRRRRNVLRRTRGQFPTPTMPRLPTAACLANHEVSLA